MMVKFHSRADVYWSGIIRSVDVLGCDILC